MNEKSRVSRRGFMKSAALGTAAPVFLSVLGSPEKTEAAAGYEVPFKIGIRAASMRDPDDSEKRMIGNFNVFREASSIPGIMGVELQVASGSPNMRDLAVVRRYKKEAHKWGMMTPTTAGVWDRGVNPNSSPSASENLLQAIRANELLGSSVALIAFFGDNALKDKDEASYAPVVEMLQKAAPYAANAGVILGLENTLDTEDNIKLVDLVDHPSVKIYYDVFNMANHGHPAEVATAVKAFGRERICAVHIKHGDKLIEDADLFDFRPVFAAFNEIGYNGWYVFESRHSSAEQCRDACVKNIAFMKRHLQMPRG